MPQLNLNFPGIPVPETELWLEVDNEYQQTLVDILARLIVNAARVPKPQEYDHD